MEGGYRRKRGKPEFRNEKSDRLLPEQGFSILSLVEYTNPFYSSSISKQGFVEVAPGTYRVGSITKLDNPLREVRLEGYYIGKFDITNEDFVKFVQATGYKTDAERFHNAMVFRPGLPEFRWVQDPTANWRLPNGVSRGGLVGKGRHPVTTISFEDALAYCKWAGVRLPSLDEWEVASRAGASTDYFFGSSPDQIGKYANVWHAKNHLKPDYSDGYLFTSPVGSFLPNPWGLYDIYGNVFEFCSGHLPSDRAQGIGHARGGSWWCSKNACCFFNSVDIGRINVRASFSNQGFRVVWTPPKATQVETKKR